MSAVPIVDVLRAAAKTDVTDDDVVGVVDQSLVGDADAVARRGLAGDGDVGRFDEDRHLQVNDAGDVEDDDAWPGGFAGFAQRAWAGVFEAGDDENLPASPAKAESSAALRAGERGDTCLRKIFRFGGPGDEGFAFFGPLIEFGFDLLEDVFFVLVVAREARFDVIVGDGPAFAGEADSDREAASGQKRASG